MHRVLTAKGIRLGGQSVHIMIKALIQGIAPHKRLPLVSHRHTASQDKILDALQCNLSAIHRFVLEGMMHQIKALETQITRFYTRFLAGVAPQQNALAGHASGDMTEAYFKAKEAERITPRSRTVEKGGDRRKRNQGNTL